MLKPHQEVQHMTEYFPLTIKVRTVAGNQWIHQLHNYVTIE